ncbi:hypothetical protein [Paraburkholderia dinghuensis]|uniref:Uncharacterized protein n=1 Tax=Paraburkholderia dinghuensis TaxID=2305225 RepID=A0A3N6M905_9BURK|nr:hypothetical protein [Paraburkholderia dinghuensis]RQH00204.1 hypothetical protein D1Y85_25555 [Paraburkholderia dinghuensis]
MKINSRVRQALLLASFCVTTPFAAYADDAAPTTFDKFVDIAPGSDVTHQGDFPNHAYRAKRVNKNLWTFIDRVGYYMLYRKKIQAWCESNGGIYRAGEEDRSGSCMDKLNRDKALGAYLVEITKTDSYQGQMTAGYATFYYFDQDGYSKKVAQEDTTNEMDREDAQLNQICYQDQLKTIQQNPQAGMDTNLGMVVDVKLPLVLIQNTRY